MIMGLCVYEEGTGGEGKGQYRDNYKIKKKNKSKYFLFCFQCVGSKKKRSIK